MKKIEKKIEKNEKKLKKKWKKNELDVGVPEINYCISIIALFCQILLQYFNSLEYYWLFAIIAFLLQ